MDIVIISAILFLTLHLISSEKVMQSVAIFALSATKVKIGVELHVSILQCVVKDGLVDGNPAGPSVTGGHFLSFL